MDRLKRLGTWIILVIAFYLFSNGIIYLFLYNGNMSNNKKINETQIVNQSK